MGRPSVPGVFGGDLTRVKMASRNLMEFIECCATGTSQKVAGDHSECVQGAPQSECVGERLL